MLYVMYVIGVDSESSRVYCGDTDKDSGTLFALAIREPGVPWRPTSHYRQTGSSRPPSTLDHRISHLGSHQDALPEKNSLDRWWVELQPEYGVSRCVSEGPAHIVCLIKTQRPKSSAVSSFLQAR